MEKDIVGHIPNGKSNAIHAGAVSEDCRDCIPLSSTKHPS